MSQYKAAKRLICERGRRALMIVMTKQEFSSRILEAEEAMYHTAYAILRNDSDCADAVQDAIFKAYKSLGSLKNPEYFKTWIIRILVNTCYSQLKSRKYTEDIEDMESIPGQTAEDDYSKTELMLEIAAMDEKYRVPLMLYYMDGFTTEEIARSLGITSAAVRKRLSRARQMLKEQLEAFA